MAGPVRSYNLVLHTPVSGRTGDPGVLAGDSGHGFPAAVGQAVDEVVLGVLELGEDDYLAVSGLLQPSHMPQEPLVFGVVTGELLGSLFGFHEKGMLPGGQGCPGEDVVRIFHVRVFVRGLADQLPLLGVFLAPVQVVLDRAGV